VIDETMKERDKRKARAGSRTGDRRPATRGVPAENLCGEAQAAHGIPASGQRHPSWRHLEHVTAAGGVEHIRPPEEAREILAILAVANEAKAGGRRDLVRDAAHPAALAAEGEIDRSVRHVNSGDQSSPIKINERFSNHPEPTIERMESAASTNNPNAAT